MTCSCTNPAVLSIKVLYQDEWPRVVLDMLVSQLATPPLYLIYDYACELYSRDIHTLWWAIEDTLVV